MVSMQAPWPGSVMRIWKPSGRSWPVIDRFTVRGQPVRQTMNDLLGQAETVLLVEAPSPYREKHRIQIYAGADPTMEHAEWLGRVEVRAEDFPDDPKAYVDANGPVVIVAMDPDGTLVELSAEEMLEVYMEQNARYPHPIVRIKGIGKPTGSRHTYGGGL